MNKSKTIYFLSAFVLIIGCYALNLSYSLFVDTQEKSIINAIIPELKYTLNNNVYKVGPRSSELAIINVMNTGDLDMHYGISVQTTPGVRVELIDKVDNNIIGTILKESENDVWFNIINETESDVTVTFNLVTQHASTNLNSYFNSDFISNSGIELESDIKLLSSKIIDNAKVVSDAEKTLGYAEFKNNIDSSLLINDVANNESLLSVTKDDIGNSYYFRGNVKNNYLLFNNMCFRIVRIEGDGSIRILFAGNVSENSSNCNEIVDNSYSGYVHDLFAGPEYGYVENQPGIYAGVNIGSSYVSANYNEENGIGGLLNSWYKSNFTDGDDLNIFGEKLKSNSWCLGYNLDKKYDSNTGNELTIEALENNYRELANDPDNVWGGYYVWNYISAKRIESDKVPSLSCLDSLEINSKVGTLTADEVFYAGLGYNSYLLNDGSLGMNTLTVKNFSSMGSNFSGLAHENSYILAAGGYLFGLNVDSTATEGNGVRPAITLLNNIEYISGDGSYSNPYIVD